MTRQATFGRNEVLLHKKFGELHKEAFGPETKLNKYGYPDMGNNIYAD